MGNVGSLEENPDTPDKAKQALNWFQRHRRVLLPLSVFLVCISAYSIVHVIHVRQHGVFVTDGDEVQYLVVTESIITDHDLSPLNNFTMNVYRKHGYYSGDIPFPALVPGTEGRLVYCHMPAMSFILLPGFWLFGYTGAAGTMILLSALAAMLTFLIMRKFIDEKWALAATFAFFLTYPMLIYSRLLYTETVVVFLVSLTLWAGLRLKESGRWGYALLAGIGAAMMFQLHVKFFALTAAAFVLLLTCSQRWKRDVSIWLIPVVLSFALLVVTALILYGPNIIHGLTVSSGPGGFFGKDSFWGIFGLYLDRSWGLFIFAPLFFIFLAGIPLPRGKKDLSDWWVFLPLSILLNTLIMGLFGKWSGEVSPVPRFLVPIVPVLTICAALFIYRCRSKVSRWLVGVLLGIQVVMTAFEVRYVTDTFAIHGPNNVLIPHILGDNWLSRSIIRVFPLFHPMSWKSCLLLAAWIIVLVGVSVYLRKRKMNPLVAVLEIGSETGV